ADDGSAGRAGGGRGRVERGVEGRKGIHALTARPIVDRSIGAHAGRIEFGPIRRFALLVIVFGLGRLPHRISIGINPERPAAEGGLGGEIMRLAALRIRSALRPLDPTRTLLIDAEGISIANALDVYLRLDLGGIAILGGQVGLALTLELLRPMLAEV